MFFPIKLTKTLVEVELPKHALHADATVRGRQRGIYNGKYNKTTT